MGDQMREDNRDAVKFKKMMALAISLCFISGIGFVLGASPSDEAKIQVDGDFIISFDESPGNFSATNPSIAVTPTTETTLSKEYAGSVHGVWYEMDEQTGLMEIHYSMSLAKTHGIEWSNDEKVEEDRIISQTEKSGGWVERGEEPIPGDAVDPSVVVDTDGNIHVIWSEYYPDLKWAVHYSRSTDNGQTWTTDSGPDRLISSPEVRTSDVSPPTIAISHMDSDIDPDVIHAVWAELNAKGDRQEIFYSQSSDGGQSWTGAQGDFIQVSDIESADFAYNPQVATSAGGGKLVHVSWHQADKGTRTDEIFYARSVDFGRLGSWEKEIPISLAVDDKMTIQSSSITAYRDDVHVVWSQGSLEAGKPNEAFYSGSIGENGNPGTWTGADKDMMISNSEDKNPVSDISVAVDDKRNVNVVWAEMDHKNPQMSKEVHTSTTNEGDIPGTWSGQKGDVVLSWPDPEVRADVSNISLAMGQNIDGAWKTQIVWEELNVVSKDKAEHGTQVHTIPEEFTLSVSTSGSGSVDKDPDQSTYHFGDSVTLTATPSAGWYFDHWTGDITGSTNPRGITIEGDMSITAVFYQYQYTFTTSVSPSGAGWIVKDPEQATYTYGQTVDLTAYANPGYEFDHWAGSLGGSINPDDVSVNGNEAVTAYFTQITYDIPVHLGWNMISVPLDLLNTNTAVALDDSLGDGLTTWDVVKQYDASDSVDHWKTYDKNWPGTQDLLNIDNTMGLWIDITSLGDGYLTVTGDYPASTGVPLKSGWNLIGYPANNDASYTVGQLKTAVTGSVVEGYYSVGPYNLQVLGDSYVLQKGESYWIKVSSDTTWTVDW